MWQSVEVGPAWARDMHVVVKIEKTHEHIHYNSIPSKTVARHSSHMR